MVLGVSMRLSMLLICFSFISSVAIANDSLQIDIAKPGFAQQQAAVMQAVNEDNRYSEISSTDKEALVSALNTLSEKLAGDNPMPAVDSDERKKIESDQAIVNSLLAKAYRDSRLICVKEPTLGSNFIKRVCKTVAARNRENQTVRDNGINVSK
jgi:hypothetical protein